nr:hypothetical protein [Tanacetum cinerariifolium]
MRTKPGVDTLSFDDLYNNLRVFETDVKGSTTLSSCTHNVVFVSSDSTNSTNEVSNAYGVSTSSGHNSQKEEEMDLKWQVAMISTRLKKFYKKTGKKLHFDAKEAVGFDKTKDEHKAMVTIDGEGVDWTGLAEDDTENYALMAFNFSNSGSYTKSKTSEYDVKTSDLASCESNSSVETLKSVPKLVESKPKAVSEPKFWFDAPIIEEYKLDSDEECMFKALVEQEKSSCAFINTVKHVNTPRQTIKDQDTCSQNPKVPKRDWTGFISKILGNGYSQKDKNEAKTDKAEHGIGKSVQNQNRRRMHLSGTT